MGAQIAEAWAKRRYEKHFISKLTDALGELNETEHWLESSHECQYLDRNQLSQLLSLCSEVGRMLSSMINKSSQFCTTSDRLQESEPTPYFATHSEDY